MKLLREAVLYSALPRRKLKLFFSTKHSKKVNFDKCIQLKDASYLIPPTINSEHCREKVKRMTRHTRDAVYA